MLSDILKDSADILKTVGYKFGKGLVTLADEEEACKDPYWAYKFARDITGADIEKCQEGACKIPWWAYCFARHIPEANVEKCRKACAGTEYAF